MNLNLDSQHCDKQVWMQVTTRICTAAPSAYLIGASLLAVPTAISAAVLIRDSTWPGFYICIAAYLLLIVWLRAYRVELGESYLTYRSLFTPSRTLARGDIGLAKIQAGIFSYAESE